jgi:ABC-type phosphate/phosphonate transport system substrate-binding protein
MLRKIFFAGLVGMVISNNVHADLTLSAPPREDSTKGKALYGPLAEYLTQITGEKVVYVHPKGWMDYSKQMRKGAYDIVFDGPHFAAWRMKHLQHMPIVRLPGTLNFVVITRKDNKKMRNHHSIARGSLCGLASPNLGTVSVLSEFENDIISPKVIEVKGGFTKVYQSFKEGNCDAAVLRDNVWKKVVPRKDKKELRVLYKIDPMPNQTITASPRISRDKRNAMIKALQTREGTTATDNILQRFSKNAKNFQTSKVTEYNGLAQLLEGVVFGW